MRRVAVLAVVCVLWLAAKPEGQAYTCMLTNRCDLGLPCEFLSELKLSKARARAWGKLRASNAVSHKAVFKAIETFHAKLTSAYREFSRCPSRVPDVHVGSPPACEIGLTKEGGVTPRTLDELLRTSSTCSELVEAEYKRAEREREACQLGNKPTTPARLKWQKFWEEQAKTDSLEQSLFRYLSSCVPDANLAQELSKMGLDALVRDGQLTREWEAMRAAKRAGR